MKFIDFNSVIGQDSYVRCKGKERIDPAIINLDDAISHLRSKNSVGWWVKTGYIVVDIDEGKEQALRVIQELGIRTLTCKTPRGLHLYFKTNTDYPQKIGMVSPIGLKCDLRCANKGYVVLPYGMDNRSFNDCIEIADLPLELTPLQNRKDSLLNLKEGEGRNSTLFNHLISYKNKGASDEQVETMATLINEHVFSEPMQDKEIRKLIKSLGNYEADTEDRNPYLLYNSKGAPSGINNRAIVDYFVNKGNIFVIGGDCHMYQEGVFKESSSYIRNAIKEMIAVDHLITQARIVECYRLLIDDTRIHCSASDINQNQFLINFKNDIWCIRHKAIIPHDSQYLQTIQIPHDICMEKTIPFKITRLGKFLYEKVDMPQDDIDMLLDYMAYCLTTDIGLKTFMILHGQSNTGKSVLIRFFEALIGKHNTSALSMHELNMRFYPAQLHGKLMNCCADNSSLPLSAIESLKKITGGDQIMHEKKGKEPFFFTSFAKLLFSFNQLPLQLEEKSNAFYKRIRILSMEKELWLDNIYVNDLCSKESIEEMIPHLIVRLPMFEIKATKKSDKLVEGMRRDSDSVHAFISTCCNTTPKKWCYKTTLYDRYALFCVTNGREAHKPHAFIRHLRARGYHELRHPETRESCWRGIGLKKEVDIE